MSAFGELVVANLRMSLRNRVGLFFTFFFPILFMVLLGLFFGDSGGTRARLDVVAPPAAASADADAARVVDALGTVAAIRLRRTDDAAGAAERLRRGDTDGVLTVAPGGVLTLRYDDSSTVTAQVLRGTLAGVVDEANLAASPDVGRIRLDAMPSRTDALSYVNFLLPGIIGISIMTTGAIGIAAAMTNLRTRGMLRRLQLAPTSVWAFIGAKCVTQLALIVIQLAILLTIGVVGFGVELTSSVVATVGVGLALLAGAICFMLLGFVIAGVSSRGDSADAVGNAITLPMMFLAGAFFPIAATGVVGVISHLLPLRYLVDALRDLLVRGNSLADVAPDLGALALFSLAFALLAARLWRWEDAPS